MRTAAPVLFIVALAGCGEAGKTARDPDPVAEPDPAPRPTMGLVTTLAGEWRVAGIDGEPFDEPYGLALSASDGELWWEPRCAGMVRSYRIAGTTVTFGQPAGVEPPPPGAPPPPVCAIGIPSRLPDVARALDAATSVTRTPENGVLISGGGRSVLLFAQ
ncbi:hypothetical protein N0B51_01115 [Tsuneonella sp. YG55]|uniref:META domain-containing protein n=1 Tax=Tsuneonella litorea TaxID=2976475 RepID=A0A9X2VYM6_9SPHN|nr:hypothetical protein [Tsuneonella litorea]MCT2557572.1 hypothetical protein [Tsuneonella litorea]